LFPLIKFLLFIPFILAIYFHVLLLLLYVYGEHEWVGFYVLGLFDESNDLILFKPSLEP